MQQLIGCSVSYRIAVGQQQGRKVFTLQTLPAVEEDDRYAQVAKEAGFSLHAGVAAQAWERNKLERLCRYISRPGVSEKRLSLTSAGSIRYQLKTAYSESLPHERSECFGYGTTHVIFDPLDFIAKLASLVPKPKVNLTRFHGVFAPNSKHRTEVTPARSGKGRRKAIGQDKTPEESRSAMTGFCSCKTGIPSIHGHNLGTTIEKGIQYRYRNMHSLRWPSEGHTQCIRFAHGAGSRLYRRPTGH